MSETKNIRQHRRLSKPDGTKAFSFEGKMHNWDGPALIPQGNRKLAKWFLFGIEYTKEEHKLALSDHTGLPWYKGVGAKERL